MLDGGAAGTGTTAHESAALRARIVLTAPLTETIDHADYFIQMSMASLPMWLELPERVMGAMGKIHVGRPIQVKTRKELLGTIKPHQWKFIPADAGDLPDGYTPSARPPSTFIPLTASPA